MQIKKSNTEKSKKYAKKYPNEFTVTPNNDIFCNICSKIIDSSRKSSIDSHRISKKHANGICKENFKKTFFKPINESFAANVVKAFVSADIPLWKLRSVHLKELFSSLGFELPSETTARRILNSLQHAHIMDLNVYFSNSNIFLIVDESEIKGVKYCNVIAGKIECPNKEYIINVVPILGTVNSTKVLEIIYDSLETINVGVE